MRAQVIYEGGTEPRSQSTDIQTVSQYNTSINSPASQKLPVSAVRAKCFFFPSLPDDPVLPITLGRSMLKANLFLLVGFRSNTFTD